MEFKSSFLTLPSFVLRPKGVCVCLRPAHLVLVHPRARCECLPPSDVTEGLCLCFFPRGPAVSPTHCHDSCGPVWRRVPIGSTYQKTTPTIPHPLSPIPKQRNPTPPIPTPPHLRSSWGNEKNCRRFFLKHFFYFLVDHITCRRALQSTNTRTLRRPVIKQKTVSQL